MKHKYLSKRYWKDNSTPLGASTAMARSFDDCINLSLGDPDVTTDELIIEKAFADAKMGHTKYTDPQGDPELREEICKFYQEEYGMEVLDKEVFVSTSACIGMFLALEAILDDQDEVIIPAPYFALYLQQIELAGGIPVELPTYEEEDFQIDMQRLESMITEHTKAIIINTPCNPTGSCLTLETMQKLAQMAEKYDLVVIADDIYTEFSYQTPFIPFASLPGMKERTITLNSFSKNFTMTGWRIGNIIAPDYLIEAIQNINENLVYSAPSISQRAAIHALRNRKTIQPKMIEEYRSRVFYAAERINAIPNMHVLYPPRGTFYLFVNIKDTGLTSQEVTERILQEAHVLVLPGDAFGTCGEGFLRIACTVNKDVLKEAFDRIAKMSIFSNH